MKLSRVQRDRVLQCTTLLHDRMIRVEDFRESYDILCAA